MLQLSALNMYALHFNRRRNEEKKKKKKKEKHCTNIAVFLKYIIEYAVEHK